jgi:hypothetical protein
LTNLPAANLTGTLPALDGSNLTGVAPTQATIEALGIELPAANLTGTVADARISTLTASKLSGVVPASNLGTGTASSSTVLYGDGTFKAEPGGGAWIFLASATASSSSEIVFDDFMDGTYDTYVLLAEGWLTSTDGAILYLLFSQDGGATYLTGTTYHHVATVHTSNGIHSDIHSQSQPTLDIVRGIDSGGGGANGDGCFTAWFQNMGASTRPYVHGTYGHRDNTASSISSGTFGGCIGGANSTIESFKLKVSSGTISTGNFRFYGVSNS